MIEARQEVYRECLVDSPNRAQSGQPCLPSRTRRRRVASRITCTQVLSSGRRESRQLVNLVLACVSIPLLVQHL